MSSAWGGEDLIFEWGKAAIRLRGLSLDMAGTSADPALARAHLGQSLSGLLLAEM